MVQILMVQNVAIGAALLMMTLVLGASFLFAYRNKKALDKLMAESFFAPKRPGPKAKKYDSKKKIYREHRQFKWAKLYSGFRHLAIIAVCGFVVPSVAISSFVFEYPRYGLASAPLARVENGSHLIITPDIKDTFSFFLTEFVGGAALDVPEVFGWQVTTVTHNFHNVLIDFVVLAYRTILDAFTLALLYLSVRLLWIATHLTEQEREDLYRLSMASEIGLKVGT